ncbi:hypothetical protein ANO11243_011900 [Dothideomycetidae sp. 11243]|nr:hypothetical protein ANO11243_011900 [fungal sp. No.11243]
MAVLVEENATVVRVGTRRSPLAIAQADSIVEQLQAAAPALKYETKVVTTMADENQSKSLQKFNSKSIWTEELEQLLNDKELDIVVHCLKDMPTRLPDSCALGGISKREDPRDVVVMRLGSSYRTIKDLPTGSVVGTSAVRRKAQIHRFFPHLDCVDIRGNINTRLKKLDEDHGPYECLVLAAAGLKRIGLEHRITHYLTANDGMLYAPGQGALGLEIRKGDIRMLRLLGSLSDQSTTLACLAERNLLRVLEGGCSAPISVQTTWKGHTLSLKSSVISPDGQHIVESSVSRAIGSADQADALGRDLAAILMELGAGEILQNIKPAPSVLPPANTV